MAAPQTEGITVNRDGRGLLCRPCPIFRHGPVIDQELLGILGKAVTAAAKGRIVVVGAYSGGQAHALYDLFCIQSSDFRIGIQLIKKSTLSALNTYWQKALPLLLPSG